MSLSRSLLARRLVASLASATVASILFHEIAPTTGPRGWEWAFLCSLIAVPAIAATLIWTRPIAAQLLARAVWWSFLLVGGLISVTTRDGGPRIGFFIVVCDAVALLASGRTGLDDSAGRFQPVAFRGTLILALVLAMADAGAFLWAGTGALSAGHISVILMAIPMAAGVIGLLRLRTWGLLLSLASNLMVAVLGATGVLFLPGPLRPLFVTTACLQLLIPVPMIVSIVRGRAPGPDRWRRAKAIATSMVIAGIVGVSLYAAFVAGPLIRF